MPAPYFHGTRASGLRARSSAAARSAPPPQRFAVSPSAAIKLMQRVRATGSAAPARYGGHRRPLLAPHEADLRKLVAATPDLDAGRAPGRAAAALWGAGRALDDPQRAPPARPAA